jgi:hypothetical protein
MKINCYQVLIFFTLIFSVENQAQNKYLEGYYLTNNGQKIDCLILDEDWKSNPTSFNYKLNENAEVVNLSIDNASVFGIIDHSRYERHEVLNGKKIKDLQPSVNNAELDFKKERLFLKVLVEGDVNLYQYEEGSLKLFFIKNPENGKVEQLIFKTYANQDNQILYNNQFRTQLYKFLNLDRIDKDKLREIDYYRKELTGIVQLSNGDNSINFSENNKKNKKSTFNIYAKAGVALSSLEFKGPIANQNLTFDDETIFRFGVDIEYVFPFNNNKWAAYANPTYQNYKAESFFLVAEGLPSESRIETNVEYNSIELPFGIRHYFFLADDSRIYLNAAIVLDANLNSSIKSTGNRFLDIRSGTNFSIGIGYQYQKFGLEFLYFTSRNLLDRYLGNEANYKAVAFQLSYKLF